MGRLVPLDVQPYQSPGRTPPLLFKERAPAGEVGLVEIDQPIEAQLQGRPVPAQQCGMRARDKIDIRLKEAGLDASDVQGLGANRTYTSRAAGCDQNVPDAFGVTGIHPELVAQVSRE